MEAVAVAPKPKEERKSQPVLMPERFGEAEFKMHRWVVDIPAGVTVEEIQDPAYWAHVSKDMDAYDEIVARADDGAWIAYLIVVFNERTYAKVALDRVVKLEVKATELPQFIRHKVEFKGGHFKHAVIRLSDNAMVQSGFKTRREADAWLVNHERGMEK